MKKINNYLDNSFKLHYLVECGNYNSIKNYINNFKNKYINFTEKTLNQINDDGKTPLHLAIENNYQDIANLLVKSGANPDIIDPKGRKAFYVSYQKGGSKKNIYYGKRYL